MEEVGLQEQPQSFVSWHASAAGLAERGAADEAAVGSAPFRIDAALNKRLVLTRAPKPWALEVDALILGNNEALSDRVGVQGEVFERGGAGLADECSALGTVRTGEARLTRSHGVGLTPRHLVHAIGPRYLPKYAVAAGSALHWCYRHALQLCHDRKLRTIAILPLHDAQKKGYPPSDGAHVALRTIRRFVELHADAFDCVLLLLPTDADMEAYGATVPLYFPRTPAELARSLDGLTDVPLGDTHGEIVSPERRIRVASQLPPASPGGEPGGAVDSPAHLGTTSPLDVSGGDAAAGHSHENSPDATGGSETSPMHGDPLRDAGSARLSNGSSSPRSWVEQELHRGTFAEREDFRNSFLAVAPSPDERRQMERRRPSTDYIHGEYIHAPPRQPRREGAAADASPPSLDTKHPAHPALNGAGRDGGSRRVDVASKPMSGSGADDERPWWQELWEEWVEVIRGDGTVGPHSFVERESASAVQARREERAARVRANGGTDWRPSGGIAVGGAISATRANGHGSIEGAMPHRAPRRPEQRVQRVAEEILGDHHDGADSGEEEEAEAVALYEDLLERAEEADLSELARREMVYRSGDDRYGRASIMLVGHRIHRACSARAHATPSEAAAAREAVALLLLRETRAIVRGGTNFVLIFLASGMPHDAGPTFDFLRTLLVSMPIQVHKRLRQFHLVHPTLMRRLTFSLLVPALWGKLNFVDELTELHEHFAPGRLLVPEEIAKADDDKKRFRRAAAAPQPPPLQVAASRRRIEGQAKRPPSRPELASSPQSAPRPAVLPTAQAAVQATVTDADDDDEVIWVRGGPPQRTHEAAAPVGGPIEAAAGERA